jgi:peptidoglycan/LPS O-acetylase OafA/YrhL
VSAERAPRLAQLESMRGWAILGVLLVHYHGLLHNGVMRASAGDPLWRQLSVAGNTGVTLFFVLSGFLLARPMMGDQPIGVWRFYLARALRILPLYYLTVGVAWVVTGKAVALKGLLLIPIGFEAAPWSGVWWSLSTEAQFYLVLPLFMIGLRHRIGRFIVLPLLATWAALHVWVFHSPELFARMGHFEGSLFGRAFAFIIGALAARLHRSSAFERFSATRFAPDAAVVLTGSALLSLLRWYGVTGQREALGKLPMFHNLEALAWAAVMLSVLALRSRWRLLLINPLFAHFGRISYSLYLVHLPILFKRLLPMMMRNEWSLLNIVSSFFLVWLVAVATHELVEKPLLRLKARATRY